MNIDWVENFDAPVTICDKEGMIVYMNKKSGDLHHKYGGLSLLGQSLLDCHPEPSRSKLVDLLKNPRTNAYTTEKQGKKKLILQSAWYSGNTYAGIVEISIPIENDLLNIIRS